MLLLEELHLKGCQNQVHDLCNMKEWGEMDPAQLKQQQWGQCLLSKCPIFLLLNLVP